MAFQFKTRFLLRLHRTTQIPTLEISSKNTLFKLNPAFMQTNSKFAYIKKTKVMLLFSPSFVLALTNYAY